MNETYLRFGQRRYSLPFTVGIIRAFNRIVVTALPEYDRLPNALFPTKAESFKAPAANLAKRIIELLECTSLGGFGENSFRIAADR